LSDVLNATHEVDFVVVTGLSDGVDDSSGGGGGGICVSGSENP